MSRKGLAASLLDIRWGGHCLISLYISILSGMAVALQYQTSEPFYSAATLELVAPFGAFWRGLHFYSSQAFLLLLICHFSVVVYQNQQTLSRFGWFRLTMSIPLALLFLFTGYVLRGDATGAAAGVIAEHICLTVPLVGDMINDLFFAISKNGLTRVYANHLISLTVLGGVCVWPHLRRYSARWRDHLPLVTATLAIAVFAAAPMEPETLGLSRITGPWFFVGLQELLRHLPPLLAGVVYPLPLVTALLFLPPHGPYRRPILLFIGLWLAGYLVLSWFGFRTA